MGKENSYNDDEDKNKKWNDIMNAVIIPFISVFLFILLKQGFVMSFVGIGLTTAYYYHKNKK